MRRAVTTLATLAVVVVLSAAAVAAAEAPERTVEPCVWQHELWSTVAELGSDSDKWTVGDPGAEWLAYTFATGWVAVDPSTPCRLVADLVRHEWMHLRMIATPGDQEPDELIADCGSWLLGSDYTPYRDRLMQHRDPCTEETLVTAKRLIFAE